MINFNINFSPENTNLNLISRGTNTETNNVELIHIVLKFLKIFKNL